ncbi:MAG: hypothetical protein DRJ37_02550 [Thermoprotei archaeon]|nr:MAG: hypothetical protein DRJ37_02550 [Thermoprotei archaeon]
MLYTEKFRHYFSVFLFKLGGIIVVFLAVTDLLRQVLILGIILNLFSIGEISGFFSLFLPSFYILLGKVILIIILIAATILSITVIISGYKLYKLSFKAERGLLRIEEKQKFFAGLVSQFILAVVIGAYITALGLGAIILGFILSR